MQTNFYMKIYTIVLCLVFTFGCNNNSTAVPKSAKYLPWGDLPEMDKGHWDIDLECKTIGYPGISKQSYDLVGSSYPKEKESSGESRLHYLGKSCYIASIATKVYLSEENQSDNHYVISILLPQIEEQCKQDIKPDFCNNSTISYTVLFEREIPQDIVGTFFREKQMNDIIKFDDISGLVSFVVNESVYQYQLPVY